MNDKYEITDIHHEQYPFLRRIRALRDIGEEVKAGALGGFVEHEGNLSFEPGDDAWIFQNAIACGDAYVDKGAQLWNESVACHKAYVSHGAILTDRSRAEDDASLRGGLLKENARVSGSSMVLESPDNRLVPVLSGQCAVYGTVQGNVRLEGTTVVISGEDIRCNAKDRLIIRDGVRSIQRSSARDRLTPRGDRSEQTPAKHKKKKEVTR